MNNRLPSDFFYQWKDEICIGVCLMAGFGPERALFRSAGVDLQYCLCGVRKVRLRAIP